MKKIVAVIAAVLFLPPLCAARPHATALRLDGVMTEENLAPLVEQFEKANGEVTILVASPGGDPLATAAAIARIEEIKQEKKLKVTCVAVEASSAALFFYESSICDVRLAKPYAFFLAHHASMGSIGGKSEDLKDAAAALDAINAGMDAVLAARMGLSPQQVAEWIGRSDRFLGAVEAVNLGLADRIAP